MPKIPNESENYSPIFKNRIILIMSDLDMNQKQFAEFVHVSQPVISNAVKYGIYPSSRKLIGMADILNYPLLYLLGESDNKEFYKNSKPINFHIRIKELASERNLKFSQIARSTNIPKDYFYEWQRLNTIPSLIFLKKIALFFHVSLDYLVGRSDDKN